MNELWFFDSSAGTYDRCIAFGVNTDGSLSTTADAVRLVRQTISTTGDSDTSGDNVTVTADTSDTVGSFERVIGAFTSSDPVSVIFVAYHTA